MNLREDILRYARDKYKTEPEYLWRRFPRYAVLRHDDNRKWYGLIMDVPRKNLGLQSKERVDILNVKLSDPFYADMLTPGKRATSKATISVAGTGYPCCLTVRLP